MKPSAFSFERGSGDVREQCNALLFRQSEISSLDYSSYSCVGEYSLDYRCVRDYSLDYSCVRDYNLDHRCVRDYTLDYSCVKDYSY